VSKSHFEEHLKDRRKCMNCGCYRDWVEMPVCPCGWPRHKLWWEAADGLIKNAALTQELIKLTRIPFMDDLLRRSKPSSVGWYRLW
jgi:hypothetical protein